MKIVGTYSPPFGFEKNNEELKRIAELVKVARLDVLAVSFGSPKGEKFIYRYLKELEVPLGISIGATVPMKKRIYK